MQTLPCGSLVQPLKHLGTHLTPLALPSGLSHCDPLFLGVSLHSPRRPRPPASECLLDCHGLTKLPPRHCSRRGCASALCARLSASLCNSALLGAAEFAVPCAVCLSSGGGCHRHWGRDIFGGLVRLVAPGPQGAVSTQ